MLEIGWTELLVIAIVLIVVVGPKDLPPMLRAFGKMTTRLRTMAGEFRSQFDEALREADLDEVRRTIDDARKLNPVNTLMEAVNPLRQAGEDIKAGLQNATTVETKTDATSSIQTPLSVPEPVVSLPDTPPTVAPAAAAATAPAQPVAAEVTAAAKPARKSRVPAEPKANGVATEQIAAPKAAKAKNVTTGEAKSADKKPARTAAAKTASAKTAATKTAANEKKKDEA